MRFLREYIGGLINRIGNERFKLGLKKCVKKIYFVLPFGVLSFALLPKRFRDRANLILKMNCHYNLNGLDYVNPNLDTKLSTISLWGGV